ncbi:MAG: class I SAM-dependent methyltransferase [Chloroflexi bacterium]|nr:class I SAM-dependent methyltransferase [Chloroflexota bacterium]
MLEIRQEHISESADSQRAYDEIYAGEGIRQPDSFYRWVLDLLGVERGKRLLDVACGIGVLVGLAARRGLVAHGVDLSPVAICAACYRTHDGYFVVGDGEALPYADETFDYVTSIGSLEHYLDMEGGTREMARVLRDNGRALILLPNTFALLGNFLHVWRTGRVYIGSQPIERTATRAEWQDLLEANGFHVVRTLKWEREMPRSLADLRWYLHHPKHLARLMLSPFVPLNLANCFAYLCYKVK